MIHRISTAMTAVVASTSAVASLLTMVLSLGMLSLSTLTMAQVFQQQGTPPQLIELYTSEGCSSCPPADARLSTLLEHSQLWQRFVPLAFHVDYWDYLGWDDPYAQNQFSQRQRALKHKGQLRSVYTPGWLVDGQEWHGFFQQRDWPAQSSRDGSLLSAELKGQKLRVQSPSGNGGPELKASVVVLAFDQSSQIKAGENRGMQLQHQFVVAQLHQQTGTDEWLFELPAIDPAQKQALAVWLTSGNAGPPVQVVAGWIE
ncbi:MAG: DUF1223 domain-containing protein [Motiliproteus sp.]